VISRRLGSVLQRSAKSVLLLGPRQTGKSTLVGTLAPDLTINLAHEPTYLEFARNPRELEERLAALPAAKRSSVFIDEVQRLPSLLNTVQVLLDRPGNRLRFLLTGSSARKLRRGNANLLPGRIHTYHLGPLASSELKYELDTMQALSSGTLPGVFTDPDTDSRRKTLRSYAATYLKEEIQAEGLTRNLEGFARFLHIAAEWSGHHLDLAKLAAAAQVARQSVVRYFEVLEDTLIVRRAEPFAPVLAAGGHLPCGTACSAASRCRRIGSGCFRASRLLTSWSRARRRRMWTSASPPTAPSMAARWTSSSSSAARSGRWN
jgi:predicted AAA+ superfamily ATPase